MEGARGVNLSRIKGQEQKTLSTFVCCALYVQYDLCFMSGLEVVSINFASIWEKMPSIGLGWENAKYPWDAGNLSASHRISSIFISLGTLLTLKWITLKRPRNSAGEKKGCFDKGPTCSAIQK